MLVTIPSGTITLRDARTRSSRTVELEEFRLATTPVTRAEFNAVIGSPPPPSEREECPADSVTWYEAVAWCNAASLAHGLTEAYRIEGDRVDWRLDADGYRLPTEAEWEWACRAGTTGPRHGELGRIAWTEADEVSGPQPVGRRDPNAHGLFDMLGNVWEWCWDFADPSRYADYRTLRGGGWADPHWSVRASVRRGSTPELRLDDVGFRVAAGAVGDPRSLSAQGWSHAIDQERRSQWDPYAGVIG